MNQQMLFQNFEHLADAPDAIPKLRAMILQMAVQGKLVPQDPDDEPTSVLLEKIAAEKERLIKEGKIRKAEPLPPVEADEVPYQVPEGWEWARLGSATTYGTLERIERGEVRPETWSLELEDVEKTSSRLLARVRHSDREINSTRNIFQMGDVLYGKLRPYLDKVLVADEPGICTTEIVPFNGYGKVDSFYLRLVLKSPHFISYATNSTHGMNLPRLATHRARLALLPLPPITTQKRIVAKVNQLMALCDELEERKKRRDKARVNLNAACLHELTSPEPKKARKVWNRIQSHFDLLYDTPPNVATLRKSILQLAVMGRLAPQDPSDEPASALLEKIAAEKERLIKEGKIKKGKPLPPIEMDEVPYEVPEGWEWVRLGSISKNIHYGYTASADLSIKNVRLLRITDIQKDKVDWDRIPGCEIDEEKADSYLLEGGDLLIARTGGTIGKTFLVEKPPIPSVFASYLIRVIPSSQLSPRFIKLFASSILYWQQLYTMCSGTGQPNVNATSLKALLLPLPPLPEQKRIVAKVDRLMALCDQLETQLAQSQRDCNVLLSAIVNHMETASQQPGQAQPIENHCFY